MAKKEPIKKIIDKIYIRKDEIFESSDKKRVENIDTLRKRALKNAIKEELHKIEVAFEFLCSEFEERFNNEWILMNDDICYIPNISAFIPDLENTSDLHSQLSSEEFDIDDIDLSFGNFDLGYIPTEFEARIFLDENIDKKYRLPNGQIKCDDNNYFGLTCNNRDFLLTAPKNDPNYGKPVEYGSNALRDSFEILTIPIYRLNPPNILERIPASDAILNWIKKGLKPSEFKQSKNIYEYLLKFYRKNNDWIEARDNKIVFSNKQDIVEFICKRIVAGKSVGGDFDDLKSILEKNEFEADDEFISVFKDVLLGCDQVRAGLDRLSSELLNGTKLGHWDLFDYADDTKKDDPNYFTITFPKGKELTALSPNIVSSTVAIDFGTKSTVVAYEDPKVYGSIVPIAVGGGKNTNTGAGVDPNENPSVVEFINFESFLNDYRESKGRPNTKWDDLTVSHKALNSFRNATSSNYYSFMTDLKSWCYSKDGYTIKDECNIVKEFPVFSEIDLTNENLLNPLEYYAYFLGLYINKMSDGNVFTKYKMSFPVIPQPEIRKKILESFTRGIRKSFPSIFFSNENLKKEIYGKNFLKEGLVEPAAYAITALTNYYFHKKMEKENIDRCYYAVFDFGGGTTDFNFGYCSKIEKSDDDEDDDEGKLFELTYFGNDADPNLGGEKLLKYLAFNVFKENIDELRTSEGRIQFTTYPGCTDSEFFYFIDLISNNSAYANANMNSLMEKLRWVWEDPEAKEEDNRENAGDFKEGKINLRFFDSDGNSKQIKLGIKSKDCKNPVEYFQKLLSDRIEIAVSRFFSAMKTAFAKEQDIKEISIFLAGNSTKSVLFNEILDKYLNPSSDKAKEIKNFVNNENVNFVVYPPLATEKANEKLQEIMTKYQIRQKNSNRIPPTGKTGVAYGLLLQDKVKIDLEADQSAKEESFQYYVGLESNGYFKKAILAKGSKIDKEWKKLWNVKEDKDEYRFLFTTSPEAAFENTLEADGTEFRFIYVDEPENGTKIFIRAISPDEIEYQVASSVDELSKDSQIDRDNVIDLRK